jgi:peptide/nickel transport system permease protein
MAIKLFQSRSWRKFTRNRLAIASLALIGLYMSIALFSFFGGITRADTQKRVLPDQTPGWLESPDLQSRIDDAEWFLNRLEARITAATERQASAERNGESFDPRVIISEIAMAERRVAELPLDQLGDMLDEAVDAFDGVYDALDEKDFALDDIFDAELELRDARQAEKPDSERIAELQAEVDEFYATVMPPLEADVEEQLVVVEAKILALQPIPEGFSGFWYGVRTFLGSDGQGRSISMKAFYSTRIAFQIGLVVAIVSVLIGTLLGAAAGFYGGWVDYAVMYVVSVLSSIPTLVLLGVLVYMFFGSALFDNPAERPGLALVPVYCAMCLTFWISTCRVIRGEVMKIKQLEYVQAATSIGFGRFYILIKHVIPNTAHLMFINLSLLFIGAIKSEVILSFLGLGVKGQPSWGTMISQAKEDVSAYFFWEVGAASLLMFGLVLAFNIVSDALQDAFDPKHVS